MAKATRSGRARNVVTDITSLEPESLDFLHLHVSENS